MKVNNLGMYYYCRKGLNSELVIGWFSAAAKTNCIYILWKLRQFKTVTIQIYCLWNSYQNRQKVLHGLLNNMKVNFLGTF